MRVWPVSLLVIAALSGCVSPTASTDEATDPAASKDAIDNTGISTDAQSSASETAAGAQQAASDMADKVAESADRLSGGAQDLEAVQGITSIGQALVGFAQEHWPGVQPGDSMGGFEVVATIEPIHVAVVAADDLRELRLALTDVVGIDYIEDDNLVATQAVPSDPGYSDQYGPDLIGAEAAWSKVGYGSSDVTVAILDTGIRRTHEDLTGRVLSGYDYVNEDTDPRDDCGHGTHVAGTAAASTGNGKGVAGMSQSTILPMKVLGPLVLAVLGCSGSASDISKAILDSADQGARIISMSLGGGGSFTMHRAANTAYDRGVLLVAASGNNGDSVDCPACYGSVIAVGAVGPDRLVADYSNQGVQMEIAAPGTDVWSSFDGADDDYKKRSGTSMATPHVAGALALALSCDPSLTAEELRLLMRSTAQDLGSPGRDPAYGFGLLRVDSLVAGLTCSAPTSSSFSGSDACGTDSDPSATLVGGRTTTLSLASDEWAQRKVCVEAGQHLQVDISGPACGLLSCPLDSDLYVREAAPPSASNWDCRPYLSGNSESCSLTAATAKWVYVGVHAASGSGDVDLTVTLA